LLIWSKSSDFVGEERINFGDGVIIRRVDEKVERLIKLVELTLLKHQNLLTVSNSGVKSMSNHQNSLAFGFSCIENILQNSRLRLAINV